MPQFSKAGRKFTRDLSLPKGRQVRPQCVDEVKELLGEEPYQRDLLIEYLHLIQDEYSCLAADHLVALASVMRLPLSEVFETATFYAHFDVIIDDSVKLPAITVRVCDSLTCEMFGGKDLLCKLKAKLAPTVRVVRAPCMGRCDTAPVAEVGHKHFDNASIDTVSAAVSAQDTHPVIPNYQSLDEYRQEGGYLLLEECLSGKKSRDKIVEIMQASPLRGLGGAGFPTGLKWKIVRGYQNPRLMAVNADEGEPGTFKDRYYLEREPHRFLEGMLIAAWVVEAQTVYIYLRDEYPAIREVLLQEIEILKKTQLCEHVQTQLRRGAGAYICGEESSMIESIEGKRGLPRHRPPYVAEEGIFGQPTLVQNVETLYWVREMLEIGENCLAKDRKNNQAALRSYSVSGRVVAPGVKLAPAGITVRDLIDNYAGGMLPGHKFKAYLPGGASGGILPASLDNLPLDFGALDKYGCFVGSHAVVILSEQDDINDVAINLMRFFEDESCGQCTPCRAGTEKIVKLLENGTKDAIVLKDISQAMAEASICGLGQAAANPLLSAMRFFPDEMKCLMK